MSFGEKQPLTPEDAARLAIDSEKEFALRATQKDHLEVYHEPQQFFDGDQSHIPDFFVLNTNNPSAKGTFVEVSRSKDPSLIPGYRNDKKKKQEEVMEHQDDPDLRYTQIWEIFTSEDNS